jgi:hypothetical protein
MHKPCLRDTLHSGRLYRLLTLGALAVLMALAWPSAIASAQSADKKTDLAIRPEFREPIVLTSKDGVLEVRLEAGRKPQRLVLAGLSSGKVSQKSGLGRLWETSSHTYAHAWARN